MKKLLGIIVLGLILNINPIITQNAFSFFKSPVETCMDKLEDAGFHISFAANNCNNFTKESLKCMEIIEDAGMHITHAAKVCNGGNKGSLACMKKVIKKGMHITYAARSCFNTNP